MYWPDFKTPPINLWVVWPSMEMVQVNIELGIYRMDIEWNWLDDEDLLDFKSDRNLQSNCSKCGIELLRIMGYVCAHPDCPCGLGTPQC